MITKATQYLLGAAFLLATVTGDASAQDLKDAAEIVKRTNIAQYYSGNDGRAVVRMKIVDGQGRSRKRQFTVLRLDKSDGGDQFYLVVFEKPADVRNTAFLVKKHAVKDDDRWLYLPGLDLVKRISASDERTSFVGSHFFYEDISGRHHSKDKHELVETSATHYMIKSTPKKKKNVEFAHYMLTVDKKTFLPSKIEYTNSKGKVYRRMEAAAVETIQGKPTITKMKVSDESTGGYTLNAMGKIKYDLGVSKGAFTEKSLRNPPEKWLK